ncbi:MAG: hypothetical protein ABSF69_10280 [Polyangiaceae bacterium]
MGVLEAVSRIVQLGGAAAHMARVAAMRAAFEVRTGAFAPEDSWFEERSRAFWCNAVTEGRFGRAVEADLTAEERIWLPALERAHRGLFRADGRILIDVWSGAQLALSLLDDESRAELDTGQDQMFDGRVVGTDRPLVVALLPGAVFHSLAANTAIERVLAEARATSLSTSETLNALLRMERTLRSLSRVKPAYAYRPEALALPALTGPTRGSPKIHT